MSGAELWTSRLKDVWTTAVHQVWWDRDEGSSSSSKAKGTLPPEKYNQAVKGSLPIDKGSNLVIRID